MTIVMLARLKRSCPRHFGRALAGPDHGDPVRLVRPHGRGARLELGTVNHQVSGESGEDVRYLGVSPGRALSDPSFPTQGDLGRMFWLLSHPNVCKVSFEELIGPQGGGSEERQSKAVTRIADFLGVRAEVETVLPRLYNRNSFSFFKGQTHAWRDVFTPYHRQLAEKRFGEMLALYGYR